MGGKVSGGHEEHRGACGAERDLHGLYRGFPAIMEGPMVFQIVVSPEETLLVFESQQVRHIYNGGPPAPTNGGSVADALGGFHWPLARHTLVVDTIARNSEPIAPRAWLSMLERSGTFHGAAAFGEPEQGRGSGYDRGPDRIRAAPGTWCSNSESTGNEQND